MLILSNEDVEQVLTIDACLEALELAFGDFGRGEAVNRPRSHSFTQLAEGHHYLFKSMDGGIARFGIHAIRMSSDHTHEFIRAGKRRREKLPLAPGGRYVGLVMLFSMETLEPLAIIQDGYLQRMRVGATSALAAKYLSRSGSSRVGLIGSGWQAGAQLLALQRVRQIDSIRAFSSSPERLGRFCADMSAQLGQPVEAAASARAAISGADIVACATNSLDPVLEGDWLEPGQHVGSVQGHELGSTVLERASLIGVRSKEEATVHYAPGRAPIDVSERKLPPESVRSKMVELGAIVGGQAGRHAPDDVTLFVGGESGASSGLGIQFAAVGYAVLQAARAAGLGREIPTEWLLETAKP